MDINQLIPKLVKYKIIFVFALISCFSSDSQELTGTWLFNNQEVFITDKDSISQSDIFNFFKGYTHVNDTLKIKHVYPKSECSTIENGKIVIIPCPDHSIPDSWYKISKLSSDSLHLRPINRSGIAVSARLKNRLHEQSKKIVSDSSYTPDYYKTIKLFNENQLFENINWCKITISSASVGWFDENYDYLEIKRDGSFEAAEKYKPFAAGEPSEEYVAKTTFYRDTLSANQLTEISRLLNKSGFFKIDISRQGYSSHGSLIKIQVITINDKKNHKGYYYIFPSSMKPLLKTLKNIVNEDETKRIESPIEIPAMFVFEEE